MRIDIHGHVIAPDSLYAWKAGLLSHRGAHGRGSALGAAVRSFHGNLKVGIVASGGVSHFVIDEQLGRGFLDALVSKGADFITTLDAAVLSSGTSEYRNWRSWWPGAAGGRAHGSAYRLPALLLVGGRHGLWNGLRCLGRRGR